MAAWVKGADKSVMIDGCFLKCIGWVLSNLTDEEKKVHIDALSLYHKYTDLFDMEDVPEEARRALSFHFVENLQDVLKLALVRETDLAEKDEELVGV